MMAVSNPPEFAGLRKRLSASKAFTHSRQDGSLSPVGVPLKNKAADDDHSGDDEDDISESVMHSYSSISSAASGGESSRRDRSRSSDVMDRAAQGGEVDVQDEMEIPPSSSPAPLLQRRSSTSSQSRERRGRRRDTAAREVARDARETETSSSSWFGFDLSIIVALVSPVGNLLTGGDHIKNAFLVLLLIYYLHQLVEGALAAHECADL